MSYKERLVIEYKELVERREVLQRTLDSDGLKLWTKKQ